MSGSSTRSPRVLLISSVADECERPFTFLRQANVDVSKSVNGNPVEDAIQVRADAVVLDVCQPGCALDAVALTCRLRQDDRTRELAIIVLSEAVGVQEEERFERARADRVLPRRCLPEVVVCEVRRVIAARRRRAFHDSSSASCGPSSSTADCFLLGASQRKVAMDIENDASRLLAKLDVLRHPSDLDLLVFFARHPRSLLASEQLSAFLGYGVKEIAASLDLLLDAKLITRTPNPAHAARLYVFVTSDETGGWLPSLLQLASTREGRLAMIWALRRQSSQREAAGPDGPLAQQRTPDPLRFPDRRSSTFDEPKGNRSG